MKDWKEEFDKHFDSPGDLMSYEPIKVFISFLLSQQRKENIEKIIKIRDAVRKQAGAFKYDDCYNDCIGAIKKSNL